MNLLITAGAASAPLDGTRAVVPTAVPRAASKLAAFAYQRGHSLLVLTSSTEVLAELPTDTADPNRMRVVTYRTADELMAVLPWCLAEARPDAVLHAAAVPEFVPAGAFIPAAGTVFHPRSREWVSDGGNAKLADATAASGQVEPEQWVRLVRAPRAIDRLKSQWGYTGLLVLMRVDADATDHKLLELGEGHRTRAAAELLVTTTVSGEGLWAFVGPSDGRYDRVPRRELAERVILQLEDWHRARVANG